MVTAAVAAALGRRTASAQQSDGGGAGAARCPIPEVRWVPRPGFGAHVFKSLESVNACRLLRKPVSHKVNMTISQKAWNLFVERGKRPLSEQYKNYIGISTIKQEAARVTPDQWPGDTQGAE